jgi:hypothetical protein
MTVHVLAQRSTGALVGTTNVRRPALDMMVERVARGLLAWSERRVARLQISHERMALLRANERTASSGGSTFVR